MKCGGGTDGRTKHEWTRKAHLGCEWGRGLGWGKETRGRILGFERWTQAGLALRENTEFGGEAGWDRLGGTCW